MKATPNACQEENDYITDWLTSKNTKLFVYHYCLVRTNVLNIFYISLNMLPHNTLISKVFLL